MRKNIFLGTMIFILMFTSSCAIFSGGKVKISDPLEYNDAILTYYTELDDQIAVFESALWDSKYSIDELQYEYDKVYRIYNYNYKPLKKIKPLKDDPGFHKNVVNFYEGVKDGLDNEYKEIMEMFSADEWLDSFEDKIYDLDDNVLDKLIPLEDAVIEKQKGFAEAYDFELVY